MGKTIRHHAYNRCCDSHCEYCAAGRQHKAKVELERMADQLRSYHEYRNYIETKLSNANKKEDNE